MTLFTAVPMLLLLPAAKYYHYALASFTLPLPLLHTASFREMQTAKNSIRLDMAVGPSSSPRHQRLQLQSSNYNYNTNTKTNSNINVYGNVVKSTSTTNEVILGLRNDARYREIMYQQFNILGTTRDPAREDKVALQIFSMFQLGGTVLSNGAEWYYTSEIG